MAVRIEYLVIGQVVQFQYGMFGNDYEEVTVRRIEGDKVVCHSGFLGKEISVDPSKLYEIKGRRGELPLNSAEEEVARWNEAAPVGSVVAYLLRSPSGALECFRISTSTPASVVEGVAAVSVIGHEMPIPLRHVLLANRRGRQHTRARILSENLKFLGDFRYPNGIRIHELKKLIGEIS